MRKFKILILILFTLIFTNLNIVNAAEELPDNAAKISSAEIIQTKTGTGPFDADDNPGNDSSEDNNIVRSFDQVTWTIENTMALKESSATSYTGGKIYFEAVLPEVLNSENSKWDLDSMIWIEDPVVSEDGRTLTGYYQMSTESTTIPGKQTLVFVLSILGASDGIEFQPTIKIWLNGNEEADKVTLIPGNITTSAAPKYNVRISQNYNLQNKVTVDYGEGDTLGRMYGYGLLIQLYNDNSSKGLKGIEYPKGDITFDIDMQLVRTLFESTATEDITSECTPVLWNYKVNNLSSNGVIEGRTMYFGNHYNRYHNGMPLGVIHKERRYSVYNSGNYAMTQNGSKLSVTVSDYAIDGTFPIWNYGYGALGTTTVYPANIGCFSVGYFEIFVPDNEASTIEDRNYYLKLTDNNFSATSNSGVSTTTQMVTTDDATNTQHVIYKKGSYTQTLLIQNSGGGSLETRPGTGDSAVAIGQKFQVLLKFGMGVTNDYDVYSASKFVKFDGDNFEPITYADGTRYYKSAFAGSMEFKVWYAAKPDGTNWTSNDEMVNANVEDMVLYENIEDIPESVVCIGEYIESTEGNLSRTTGDNNCVIIPIKVKDTATIGETYGFIQRTKVWLDYLDRDVYTITNEDAEWPTPTWDFGNRNYIKTEYDEDGKVVSGTHSGGALYGNTVLVIAADLKVQKVSVDADGNEKVNYDISKNEYDITYKITPTLNKMSTVTTEIKNVTVKIKDILPDGLKYVTGSCEYGEPEITENSDGTTTLIWYIYDCEAGKAIEPIYYQAHIDESTPNGTQYTNTVIVSADADKVGNISEAKRTATYTNQIINLASHRLYKTTDDAVIELNDTIKYTLTYKNNTDSIIPEFQLLDILPYNGDGRGTSYNGTYKIEQIDITRYDADGNLITSGNVVAYYINNEEIRNGYSAKDDFISSVNGWTTVAARTTINNYATAIALKGEASAQERIVVDIYLKTENNKAEDIYCNSATAQTNLNTEEISSSIVKTDVIKRVIEGRAFIDKDYDSVISDGDTLEKNIEVSITDENNNQVTDIYGNIVSSVKTDENGYYKFENLAKGKYIIQFNITDKSYIAVEKSVGTNITINSKVNEDFATDVITTLDSDTSSKIVASDLNAGLVKKPTKVIVNYKEEGTNTVLHDEVTIDGRIDDSYTTVDKIDTINTNHGNKYEYVRVEGNTTGAMTEDTIYVTYYYQKKETNVKVLHVVQGTDVTNPESVTSTLYQTENITGRVDAQYTTQNRLTEINTNHKEQYDFVKVTDNATGNMTVDTIYVIYEYKTIPAVVKVNHLEKDTNTILNEQETLNGLVGNDYTTVDRLTEINNKFANKYELVAQPTNKNGSYTRDEQQVTYYYQKKLSSIEVNYLELGTNNVLSEQITSEGRIDDDYTTENKLNAINKTYANKYEFVKVDGNVNGSYTLDKQVITYWYQKKGSSIEVNYLEVGTNVILETKVTSTGRVDEPYTTVDKIDVINGKFANKYEFVKVDGNTSGTYTVDKQVITYYYQKKMSSIEVNYLEVGTNNVLSEQITNEGRIDDDYTTENKLDEINEAYANKYEFVKVDGNANGSYTLGKQVITYWYQKKESSIEVNYLEIGTNEVLETQVTKTGRIDDDYTTENKLDVINETYANKYEFVKVEGNAEGKYTLDKQVITYYYQKKLSSIEVNYLEVGTNNVLSEQITSEDRIDNPYTTENKLDEVNETYANKYEFVKVEGNAEGKYTLDKQIITYWYQKKMSSVEVNYLEIETNEVLETQVTKTGRIDDDYTTENKLDIINENFANKYEFVKVEGNTEGKFVLDKKVVTYYYQKKPTSVVTKYIDINTDEEIYDQAKTEGRVDDKYTTVNELDNINVKYENKYEFVKSTENTTGNMKVEQIDVVYYYQKKEAKVVVLHVEEGTDVSNPENVTDTLYQNEEIGGRVDDSYTTQNRLAEINASHIEQYDFVRVTDNATGNLALNVQYVIYEYKKIPAKINIKHEDIGTREELVEKEIREDYVGVKYTTSDRLEEINELYGNKYELIGMPANKDGVYEREEKDIIYYYQKKETNVIVKYVDVDTEEELANSEEIFGRVDDEYTTKDKVEEINENYAPYKYALVKTTENVEGAMAVETIEVVYYYQKVEAQVIVKYVDEKTGEDIADKEFLGGYVGDEYTTSSKEIEGYELLENKLPENSEGKFEEETIEVVYYYSKIPEPVVDLVEPPATGDVNLILIVGIMVISIFGIKYIAKNSKKI
ncbi:MAG: MucBP domain-containing protein [Clostridia bacterium]|nr:MucBP domain-containing protein [Clostridia bacterium]